MIDGLGPSTFGGVISGVGSGGVGANVVKNGIGTAALNAGNSYVGLTTVNNGILQVGNANSLGHGSETGGQGTVVNPGASLQVTD